MSYPPVSSAASSSLDRRGDEFARRMNAVATRLLDEFEDLPILRVIGEMNAARREIAGASDGPAAADAIYRLARDRLTAA